LINSSRSLKTIIAGAAGQAAKPAMIHSIA
jgi:hypothetical protein